MPGPLVYMVCSTDDLDPEQGTCAHVQYVQAPNMLPPLSLQAGTEIAVAIMGLWYLAAVWRRI
jgi:hypothetical protein